MSRKVGVIGAGAAGLAAAWSAKRQGHHVTVIGAGAGATSLMSGALDLRPWELIVRTFRAMGELPFPRPLPRGATDLARELGLWDLPEIEFVWLATAAGRIRPARGRDRSLLSLSSIPKGRVLLPRAPRAGWDADSLARALSDEPWARAREIEFQAIDAPVLRFDDERRIADGDLAARHDDDERLAWLGARIREVVTRDALARGGQASAVLVGPWLGASAPRAEAASARAGLPVGEVVFGLGSPAGLRFEVARDALLEKIGVKLVAKRALSLDDDGNVTVAGGDVHAFDAVIIAVGGLAGGGIVYTPPEHLARADLPPGASAAFALSFDANVALGVVPGMPEGDEMDVTSSLHGPELDLTAWPGERRQGALEAAGLRCDGARVRSRGGRDKSNVLAAGDAIAGRPRTLLEAIASGVRAGLDVA